MRVEWREGVCASERERGSEDRVGPERENVPRRSLAALRGLTIFLLLACNTGFLGPCWGGGGGGGVIKKKKNSKRKDGIR